MKCLKKLLLLAPFSLLLTSCTISINPTSGNDYTVSQAITYTESSTNNTYSIDDPDTPGDYTVTLECNNGYTYTTKTTKDNKITKPSDPVKEFAEFKGWYLDTDYENLFDFSKSVSEDITLYAGYDISYQDLTNYIYTNTIKSNVKFKVSSYNQSTFGRASYASSYSQGSGAIFYYDGSYYYALTNNHVCAPQDGYSYVSVTVEDCFNNEYTGSLIARDKDYDLAIVKFKGLSNEKYQLEALNIASYKPFVGSEVIAIGDPYGLHNTISYGYVDGYENYEPDKETIDLNNITFEVLVSNCYIASGSSGGALIDTNLNLVGINFASATKYSGEYVCTYSIPYDKIKEFINLYLK